MVESDDSLKGKEKAEWVTDDTNLPVEPARRSASQEAKRIDSGHTPISKQNSDSSLLFAQRCDTAWIKLVVGEKCSSIHPAERQLLSLVLPAINILYHSRDLRTRDEVAGGQTIQLPMINPKTFLLFVRWVQDGNLHVQQPSRKAKPVMRDPKMEECLAAWELGQELIAPRFQNACIDQIVKIAIDQSSTDPRNLPYGYIKHAYAIATHNSGLRKLFRAIMCEEKLPREWLLDNGFKMEKLGAVAYEEYRTERTGERGKTWDRVKRGKEGKTWREGGEQFHEQ
jgi:hypothetical protein